jgi:hypothetical protein
LHSTAIGTNANISSSAEYAVALSAYSSKSCATTEPGSLKLCADKNVTIEGLALVVNGVDVLKKTTDLDKKTTDLIAALKTQETKLAAFEAQVAALQKTVAALQKTGAASGSLVGTLLALSLTAAAVA